MDAIQSYKTLTGLTLEQVAKKLDAELPKDAYKAVPGAAGLTDIDPNYMRQVLNETFGICGLGWGYSYAPDDMTVVIEERTTRDGKKRRVHVAALKHLRFWYKLQSGNTTHICEISASGGSDNEVESYAMSGSITNALGKAVSNLGFQESVYLGRRSHTTVGKPAPKAAAAPSAKAAPKPASKPAAPAAKDDEIEEIDPIPASMGDAASFVITEAMTSRPERVGQTLGAQSLEAIEWWANKMVPANNEQNQLQAAAQAFLKVRSNGHEPVAA